MHSQYEHERQVKVIVDRYHRDAIKAEHLRLARAGRPTSLSTLTSSLRTTMAAMVSTFKASLHRTLVTSVGLPDEPGLTPVHEALGDTTDAPVIA